MVNPLRSWMHSLDLYRRLVGIRIRGQAQYRWSFFMDVLSTAILTLLGFGSLALIFDRFGSLAGWKLMEIGLLFGMVEASFGCMDMLFSGFDPPAFGQHIRRGTFDQILLRPVSATLQVLASEFVLRRIGRILQGFAILIIALSSLDIQWTLAKAILLPVTFLSQIAFFGGLFITGATITFWSIESIEVLNIFTYGGNEMMSYPMDIYQDWMRRFFTYILPAIFLNYYPALYLLDKPDPFGMPGFAPFLAPLVGAGVLGAGLAFWNYGIRYYQSTGS